MSYPRKFIELFVDYLSKNAIIFLALSIVRRSTNPTRPLTRNTMDEHLDMLMVCRFSLFLLDLG